MVSLLQPLHTPAVAEIQTSFTQELCRNITSWTNSPIPSDPAARGTQIDQAIHLLSKVTSEHNAMVTGHNATVAQQDQALTQARETIASLNKELHKDEDAANDRVLIRASGARLPAPGGAVRRPVSISDPTMFDGHKDDLEAFLERLANKLRGYAAQFTSEIH